ncbi:MAG: hypothetical protein R3F46_12225 [bacterium]
MSIGKTLYDWAAKRQTIDLKLVRTQTGTSSTMEYVEISATLIGYDGYCLYLDTTVAENKIIPMNVVHRINPSSSFPG